MSEEQAPYEASPSPEGSERQRILFLGGKLQGLVEQWNETAEQLAQLGVEVYVCTTPDKDWLNKQIDSWRLGDLKCKIVLASMRPEAG